MCDIYKKILYCHGNYFYIQGNMEFKDLEDILLAIALKDDDLIKAHDSFSTLYKNFSKQLQNILKKVLKDLGKYDEELLDVVMNNTFYTIYDNPPLEFEMKGNANLENCFLAYLVKIAKHDVFKQLKIFYGKEIYLESDIPDVVFEEEEFEEYEDSTNIKILNQALNQLRPEHREILLALYNYHEEGKNTPTQVLDILCETYGTTRDNIRQIKKRSEDKVKEYIKNNSNLIPQKNVKKIEEL